MIWSRLEIEPVELTYVKQDCDEWGHIKVVATTASQGDKIDLKDKCNEDWLWFLCSLVYTRGDQPLL